MNRAAVVITPAALALLAGCGSVQAGLVEAKAHDEMTVFTTIIPTSCGNGCTSMIPVVNTIPECWRLDLRSGEETGSVCVDQPVWEATQVGQRYDPGPSS